MLGAAPFVVKGAGSAFSAGPAFRRCQSNTYKISIDRVKDSSYTDECKSNSIRNFRPHFSPSGPSRNPARSSRNRSTHSTRFVSIASALLPRSFALLGKSTPFVSIACALFAQNTGVWGTSHIFRPLSPVFSFTSHFSLRNNFRTATPVFLLSAVALPSLRAVCCPAHRSFVP